MTNRKIMDALYQNAEISWAENHNGQSKSATVIYEEMEYVIFASDKPILEEVQRKLELADKWEKEHECSRMAEVEEKETCFAE